MLSNKNAIQRLWRRATWRNNIKSTTNSRNGINDLIVYAQPAGRGLILVDFGYIMYKEFRFFHTMSANFIAFGQFIVQQSLKH